MICSYYFYILKPKFINRKTRNKQKKNRVVLLRKVVRRPQTDVAEYADAK